MSESTLKTPSVKKQLGYEQTLVSAVSFDMPTYYILIPHFNQA